MKITFLSDPIDLNEAVSILESDGIVVLFTTRPNARTIWKQLEPRIQGFLLHLVVEGDDLSWYDYLLYGESNDVSLEASGELVKKAARDWIAAGQPDRFMASV